MCYMAYCKRKKLKPSEGEGGDSDEQISPREEVHNGPHISAKEVVHNGPRSTGLPVPHGGPARPLSRTSIILTRLKHK
jgi:hypothetical protein